MEAQPQDGKHNATPNCPKEMFQVMKFDEVRK